MANEGWEMLIKGRHLGVNSITRFYFDIEVVDVGASYRERLEELSLYLWGGSNWWGRWLLLFPITSVFYDVRFRKIHPTFGPWGQSALPFVGSHGDWLFPWDEGSNHMLISWISAVSGNVGAWNTIGPLPWPAYHLGRIGVTWVSLAKDFGDRHLFFSTGVLGDFISGGCLTNVGTVNRLAYYQIRPYTGRSKRRRLED
jgi:hypothetical protein